MTSDNPDAEARIEGPRCVTCRGTERMECPRSACRTTSVLLHAVPGCPHAHPFVALRIEGQEATAPADLDPDAFMHDENALAAGESFAQGVSDSPEEREIRGQDFAAGFFAGRAESEARIADLEALVDAWREAARSTQAERERAEARERELLALLGEVGLDWYDEYRGCYYGWCKFCGASGHGRGATAALDGDQQHSDDCFVSRIAALRSTTGATPAQEHKA